MVIVPNDGAKAYMWDTKQIVEWVELILEWIPIDDPTWPEEERGFRS